ncbi:MAG: hypothetical protein AB7D29_01295 [Campylobacterales bacterium]
MERIDRREASKLMGIGLLAPMFLRADGTLDVESPSADYELARNKDGSMDISSKQKELKFKVAKNAFLLRPNSKISLNMSGVAVKSMKLLTGGVMGVFSPGSKTVESRTFTAGIRGSGIYLEEKDETAVYMCLCYGAADYMDVSSRKLMELISKYHDKPVVISKEGKIYDDKTHNHDDDELRALEKMCDREPPFEKWLMMQKMLSPQPVY